VGLEGGKSYSHRDSIPDRPARSQSLYRLNYPTHFTPLTPNDHYIGRTAPLTSKVAFYIFIQQIYVLNILNVVYTVRFFFNMQFVS
jgi:hypothetical protein